MDSSSWLLEQAEARLGRTLAGRWELLRLISIGGMAAVYEASHRNGKRVAIKVLHANRSADPRILRRFLREGYAANSVAHAQVVTVDDDGVDADGTAFLVMELLRGESLDAYQKRGARRMPPDQVVELVSQLLDVLTTAHAKGIIHRDIKPANLFVTEQNVLKVLDFGLARLDDAPSDGNTSTRDGALLGTPAFMPPEQARGSFSQVDARTDIWAVGATMFTLLSGRLVHEAETSNGQLGLAMSVPAPLLRSVAPDVPAWIAKVVDRALAFEQKERWDSAASMRAALLSNTAGVTSSPSSEVAASLLGLSTLDGAEAPQTKPTRRNGRRWTLGFGIGVVIAAAAIVWGIRAARVTKESASQNKREALTSAAVIAQAHSAANRSEPLSEPASSATSQPPQRALEPLPRPKLASAPRLASSAASVSKVPALAVQVPSAQPMPVAVPEPARAQEPRSPNPLDRRR